MISVGRALVKSNGGGGGEDEHGAQPVRLHDLISSESLVAPPRLKLYNGCEASSVSRTEKRVASTRHTDSIGRRGP